MKHSVPTTSSGTDTHQAPVSRRPNAAAPRPRKIAICTSAIATVTATRAPTTVRVETGASWSRRSSLLWRQPWSVAAAPKLALIATAQPSRPGVTNWIGVSESSSTRSVSSVYVGGVPGRGDVGAVDEGAQRALGDRGLHLVGLRVVGDQGVAVLLDRDVGVALADLREGRVEVVGARSPRRCRRRPPCASGGQVVDERRRRRPGSGRPSTATGRRRSRRRAPGTSAGRRSRRTPRPCRAQKPAQDRDGEAPERRRPAAHARYSRPVRSRKTSSRVPADRTRRAVALGQPRDHRGGRPVVSTSPSAAPRPRRRPSSARASSRSAAG